MLSSKNLPEGSREKKPGFMLIEPLVALAVAAIIMGVIAQYHATASIRNYDTRMRMEALSQATTALEKFKYSDKQAQGEQSITLSYDFESMSPLHAAAHSIDQSMCRSFKIAKVTATWQNAAGVQQSLFLTAGLEGDSCS